MSHSAAPLWWFQVIADLEEEKRKHAEDTAEGDDVTYILEKERERLLQQVQRTDNIIVILIPGSPREQATIFLYPNQNESLLY